MKSSLASATSLIALLALESLAFESGASATPTISISPNPLTIYDLVGDGAASSATITVTINGGTGQTFSITSPGSTITGQSGGTPVTGMTAYAVAYTYTAATNASSASTTVTVSGSGATSVTETIKAMGVAPVNSVTSTDAGYVRVGTSATGTVTITNTGNGNKSSLPTATTNLNGTISSSVGTGFTAATGNPTSVSLNDSKASTLGFTYTPLSRGTSSTTVTTSFSNGNTAGTNAAQTITATVSATGVAPVYASTYNGTTLNPTMKSAGATSTTGPTVFFYSPNTLTKLGSTLSTSITLLNTTTDTGAPAALTNLTIKSYTLTGAGAADFQLTLPNNSVIGAGGTLNVPITVLAKTLGVETATLTVFTDEGAALGGIGDTFTYVLTAAIPEPATLVTLGAGLAGLAFVRRRRLRLAATPAAEPNG